MKNTHKYACVALFCFSLSILRAQQFVANPSFETYSFCPAGGGAIQSAYSWLIPYNQTGSPDYFNVCSSSNYAGVPTTLSGTLWPASGNAYAGVIGWYNDNWYEYMQTQLTEPMLAGHVYSISLKYAGRFIRATAHPGNMPNPMQADALGFYLSTVPCSLSSPSTGIISVVPQYQPMLEVTDNWKEVSFEYMATGGEEYLTIGNFKEYATTFLTEYPPELYFFLYFIDDVSVTCTGNICIDGNTTVCLGNSTSLSANSFGGNYTWMEASAPNTVIGTGSSLTVSPTDTTMYYVYDGNDTGKIMVYVVPNTMQVSLGNNVTACSNNEVTLTAMPQIPGTQYTWQNGNTGVAYVPTQSGTYWVTASLNGCHVSDTVQVTLIPSPEINLGNDTVLCEGQTLMLDVAIPNATYLWQNQSTTDGFVAQHGGTYWVTVTQGLCNDTDSITVTDVPNPAFNLGNDTGFCTGNPVVLDVTISSGTYRWQNNSTASTFTPAQSGTYWVEVTLGTCTLADSIDITVHPLPVVDIGNDSIVCIGNTVLLDATAPGFTYQWQDASVLPTYTVSQSGTYAVLITDSNHCQNSDSVQVTYISPPDIDFDDSTLCFGDVWILDINTPYATYLWQDKSVLPNFVVTHEGLYWCMASNACGSDADSVEVDFRRCNCNIYIPNSFTPDQNNINETFKARPDAECSLQEYTFSIFDRWGQLLFETQDASYGWDGGVNGTLAQMGMYTYRLHYKFDKTPREMVLGKVNLIR